MSRYIPTPARGHPPSPPDTELAVEPSMLPDPRQRADSDIASPYSRRAPSIFYKQNDAVPTRESSRSKPHHRWLVIVIPPAILEPERVDESSRRSSAVLLPLFPSMYAQLAAIAREFNLPSTTGLRVYLHLPEGSVGAGLLMPRVTDEVWPLLWTQHFSSDGGPTPPGGVPIGGRIEFDLDLNAARWYNAWARSHGQIPISRGPASFVPNDLQEDSQSVQAPRSEVVAQPSRPTHIRQLSLLDRRPSARNVPFPITTTTRTPLVRGPSGDSATEATATGLPSVQMVAREPREEVESMVNKWRANTPTVNPGAIHASPEPSPRLLDLDEFTWSISSAGPLTYDPYEELLVPSAVRSMHLADRAAGSVILTPTTATSFGPPRSGFSHEGSLQSNASRYPSPDLAARAMFEVPLTPDTATSWGPASEDFDYAVLDLDSRHPSPDLAARMIEDAPLTPATATSWGPPDDDYEYDRASGDLDAGERTPDLGERFLSPTTQHFSFDGPTIFSHVWPYTERSVAHDAHAAARPNGTMFNYVWPYSEYATKSQSVRLVASYPNITLYPAVYPVFEIYPPATTLAKVSGPISMSPKLERQYPNIEVYAAVYPFNLETIYPNIHEEHAELPVVDMSSLVYPFAWDYTHKSVTSREIPAVDLSSQVYPFGWDFVHQPKPAQSLTPASTYDRLPKTIDGVHVSSMVYPFTWDYAHQPSKTVPHPAEAQPSASVPVLARDDGVDAKSLVYPFGWDYVHHYPTLAAPTSPATDPASQRYPFAWDYKHQPIRKSVEPPVTPIDLASHVYPFGWDYSRKPTTHVVMPPAASRLPAMYDGMDMSSLAYPFTWDYVHQPAHHPVEDVPSAAPVLPAAVDGVDVKSLVYPFGWDYAHHHPQLASPPPPSADPSSQVYPFTWNYTHQPVGKSVEPPVTPVDFASHVYPFGWDYTPKPVTHAVLPTPPAQLPASYAGVDMSSLAYPFTWDYVHQPAHHPVEDVPSSAPSLPTVVNGVDVKSLVYPFGWDYVHHPPTAPIPSAPLSDPSSQVYPFSWDYTRRPIGKSDFLGAPTYASPHLTSGPSDLPPTHDGIDIASIVCPFAWNYTHRPTQKPAPSLPVLLKAAYPTISIYAPVYPYNLEHIYPATKVDGNTLHAQPTVLHAVYPNLVIYSSVYPYNLERIYPSVGVVSSASLKKAPSEKVSGQWKIRSRLAFVQKTLEVEYPAIDVYRPVYPYNLDSIYPAVKIVSVPAPRQLSVTPPSSYPFLSIYPDVYPSFNIYPTRSAEMPPNKALPTTLPSLYPFMVIYDKAYPHIEIYPTVQKDHAGRQHSLDHIPSYPYLPSSADDYFQEVEVDTEAELYRDELLKSAISFGEDDFDLEINGEAQHSRRSSGAPLGVMSDDEDLQEMDSPTRRFYLARQQDLRRSVDLSDDESLYDDDVEGTFEVAPITFSGRPSLSLDVPHEASGFFDDEDDEDELYAAYEQSRPPRFPRPNLSAVTEESASQSRSRFTSPHSAGSALARSPPPQMPPLSFRS